MNYFYSSRSLEIRCGDRHIISDRIRAKTKIIQFLEDQRKTNFGVRWGRGGVIELNLKA